MLALFLAIALLGTDGAYGRSTIDLTGDNHDNTDLGGSELHAKAGAYYGGDYRIDFTGDNLSRDDLPALTGDDFANAIDFTGVKLEVDIWIGWPVTANNNIGLAPSRPSPPTPSASPSPPSASPPPTPKTTVDGGLTSAELWEVSYLSFVDTWLPKTTVDTWVCVTVVAVLFWALCRRCWALAQPTSQSHTATQPHSHTQPRQSHRPPHDSRTALNSGKLAFALGPD